MAWACLSFTSTLVIGQQTLNRHSQYHGEIFCKRQWQGSPQKHYFDICILLYFEILTFNLIIFTLFYVEIIESEYPHGIKHHVTRKGGHS